MLALGLMSGTSADGVDAALLWTDGHRIERAGPARTTPYPEPLRLQLLALMADPARAEHDDLQDLTAALTHANLQAARALWRPGIELIGLHGQTVLHRPERRLTRQLSDGAALACALGVPVVDQFRQADVAAGGQGAPLAPLFHQALLASSPHAAEPVAVLNLGGVANVTYVDADTILAFDTGPASALLDDWVRARTGAAFDRDGALAAAGQVDRAILGRLLAHPFFDRPPPKSLDRNAFSLAVVDGLSLQDGAATLAAFTIAAVARARDHLPKPPHRWLVGGGGRHNRSLMQGLASALGTPADPVEALGWDGDALEAQAFAYLAVRTLHGLPLSLPTTTGVPRPMPGGVLHRP